MRVVDPEFRPQALARRLRDDAPLTSRAPGFQTIDGTEAEIIAEAKTDVSEAWSKAEAFELKQARQGAWARFLGQDAPQAPEVKAPPKAQAAKDAEAQAPKASGGFQAPQRQEGESAIDYFARFAASLQEWAESNATAVSLHAGRQNKRRAFHLSDPLKPVTR